MDAVTGPLLAEIDRFIAACGISDSAFGQRAVKDHKFVSRLRNGSSVNSKTVSRVREFIAEQTAAVQAANTAAYVVNGESRLTGTVVERHPDGDVVIQTAGGRFARLPRNWIKEGT